MSEQLTRYIEIDGWIFEIKALRALKVDKYGEPYRAIANISLNGDTAFIDGLMTKTSADFEPVDYQKLTTACKLLAIDDVNFGRDMFAHEKKIQLLNQA